MEPLFDLAFDLPPRGSRALLSALHSQLRVAILDGRLLPGVRLPATRALAKRLGVSRNTATAAYELLLGEGYLTTRHGSGTYVATTQAGPPRKAAVTAASLARKLTARWRDATPRPTPSVPTRFDFRSGYPEQRQFPFDVWRRLIGRAVRASARDTGAARDAQGDPELRRAIAHHVSATRAVSCRAEDVVVTAGSQQAFDLLARILVTPGRTVVALENPGYTAQRAAFVEAGAVHRGIPVDEEGLVVDRLPEGVDVIGVAPSHQFPLGVTMSPGRRAALLSFARAHQAVVIEDDYDGEFRLSGRPLDALQTLDREQRVFYVGTFSKSMFPSLRVGFVVTPPWARSALVAVKQVCNWHVPAMTQDALAAFISEGHLARHVRRMRRLYAERHAALTKGLQRHFGTRLVPLPSLAGLHVAALLNDRTTAESWVEAAGNAGIRLEALARYSEPPERPNGLIFGYGLISTAAIESAIRALSQVMTRYRKGA
jgi:GntR family transcriptional regulator/MocR family aminotransferase